LLLRGQDNFAQQFNICSLATRLATVIDGYVVLILCGNCKPLDNSRWLRNNSARLLPLLLNGVATFF